MTDGRFPWVRVLPVSVIVIVPAYLLSAVGLLMIAGNLDVAYALGISDTAANAIPVAVGSLLAGTLVGIILGTWLVHRMTHYGPRDDS